MKEFKIRASAAIQIAANPQSKSAIISKGGETYCNNWILEQMFGRRMEISSKYIDKGNDVEGDAIKFLNPEYVKNEKHFEDDFFTGTPDIIPPEKIIDIKSSWDIFSFPFFDDKINKAYILQGQIYMHLTGVKKFQLSYILMDTPDYLIEREVSNFAYKHGIDADDDVYNLFKRKMTFSDIPKNKRIRTFNFDYDENIINELKNKVLKCRQYINLKINNYEFTN